MDMLEIQRYIRVGSGYIEVDRNYLPDYQGICRRIYIRKNAIQIDDTVLFWDNITNFEYGTLSAREYDGANSYKEFIWDYDGCKNNYYTIYKNVA